MATEKLVDKVEMYVDKAGEWRWTAKAGNNKGVADSSEGYKNKVDCWNNAQVMFPGVEITERETK
jgi:uncharacterized protein YegP (UPF0339 family)